jgi:hypothetical protein
MLAGLTGLLCAAGPAAVAQAKGHDQKAAATPLLVCKHGCRYATIQAAVNHSGKNATIDVKPGKYVEGVVISGHKHNGLRIIGLGKKPSAVLLEGKNAHGPNGLAQSGIEGDNVNGLDLENMKAEHYPANGFFINGCHGYLMKNLIGAFEHSYGLYVFKCVGGQMTHDVGYGNGDSAYYIGGTPFQTHPVESVLDHDVAYENVLGYSGTNSKYVTIRNSVFYNNGTGIAPNTLSSEPWEPTEDGVIEDNLVFWNNFDYFRKGSPVKTVSSGIGPAHIQYPVGAGIVLFGATHWIVKDNSIFGNYLIGASAVSDPTNSTGKAINDDNEFIDNKMGAAFNDTNGYDFFNDGSGKGTCFDDNGAGVTVYSSTDEPDSELYPTCPTTNGTGTTAGDGPQDAFAFNLVSQTTGQEQYWHVHPHPPRKGYKPYEG